MVTVQRVCRTCGQARPFEKQGTSNVFHLLMSVVTCGLWIPVWIFCGLLNGLSPMRCRWCGQEKWL